MIPGIMAGQVRPILGAAYPDIRSTHGVTYNAATAHTVVAAIPQYAEVGDRMFVLFVADDGAAITIPAGWAEIANNFTAGTIRINCAWRDKVAGDGSFIYTTATSVRTTYVSWALKAGTFSAAAPSISAGVFSSGTTNDPAVVTDLGAENTLVVAALGIGTVVPVAGYPLPNSQFTQSGVSGGVSAAICAANNTATSYDPAPFSLSSATATISRSIMQRGIG